MSTPTYLAIDLETTGLDSHTDAILEVAAFQLDENLVELDRYVSAVECPDEVLDRADHVVLRMHLGTGLIERLSSESGWWVGRDDMPAAETRSLADVEKNLSKMLDDFPERPMLVGQGVHFDRAFLREYMPNVERRLSHRMVDARTVMQLAPELPWPEPKVKHVAEHDLDATVDALRMARGLMSYCGDTYGDLVSARHDIYRLLDELDPHACDGRPRDLMAQIKRALAEVERTQQLFEDTAALAEILAARRAQEMDL